MCGNDPKCSRDRCFAYEDGYCRALADNSKYVDKCPFFKDRAQTATLEMRRFACRRYAEKYRIRHKEDNDEIQ